MYSTDGQRGSGSGPPPRLPPPLPGPSGRQSFPKSLSDKYRLGEELGRGAFGQVYLGLDTRTGQHVAIKQLSLERIPGDSLQGIMNEVELLRALRHRNIVTYIGSLKSSTHLYIILEFMENGALSSVIKASKFGPFPESLVAVYIQQVLQGLAYLHDQGVVHRDIKGANILTTKDGLVKLADFGVAAKLVELEAEGQQGREVAEPVGTPYWMAPEVVELKSVTTASDIWSVGCLAIELLTGSPPYYELQPMSALYNIVQDPHPPLPPGISTGFCDFLLKCFQKDPAARPTARQLLQHSWITYNRRTLKSSWSRTRGLKARGGGGGGSPLAEGYTTVSTVVERILQNSASDGESGTAVGTTPSTASSTSGVSAGSSGLGSGAAGGSGGGLISGGLSSGLGTLAGLGMGGVAAAGAGAPSSPHSLTALEHQQQAAAAAVTANGTPGGTAAHRSSFSVAAALGGGGRPPAFGSVVSIATSGVGTIGGGGGGGGAATAAAAGSGSADGALQSAAEESGGSAVVAAPAQRHRRLWSGAVAGPPPRIATPSPAAAAAAGDWGLPLAPSQQQQQGAEAGADLQQQQDWEQQQPLEAAADPTGIVFLQQLEQPQSAGGGNASSRPGSGGTGGRGQPVLPTVTEDAATAAVEESGQSRQEAAEVRRQVAGMRILSSASGERSLQQEAGARASCRALLAPLARNAQLRTAFLVADGASALRELLDNPSDRVLEAALDLLLVLSCADGGTLRGLCQLGFIPAVLRFALPSNPFDLRHQAAAFAQLLCRSCGASAAQLVACQGVPFLRDMVDEPPPPHQPPPPPHHLHQQLELAGAAVSCFWLLLRRSQQPSWPLSLNQLLRLYAHHNLPLRLVRLLPRLLPAAAVAAAVGQAAEQAHSAAPAAAGQAQAAALTSRHARSPSYGQGEAEVALLADDELAAGTSLALSRCGAEEEGGGYSSPGSPSRQRWLGLPGSMRPSRLSRLRSSRPSSSPERGGGGGSGSSTAGSWGPAAGVPEAPPEAEAAQRLGRLVDGIFNLLAAMAHGDAAVKARLCQREVLRAVMEAAAARHVRPELQLRVLRWVRQLTTEQLVLQALEEAGTVPYVVAQLRQPESATAQALALGALHHLCQLSRVRQEAAAENGAVPLLVVLVQHPAATTQQQQQQARQVAPSLAAAVEAASVEQGAAAAADAVAQGAASRSLAVSLLCGFAHGGTRSRGELWAAGGFDALLALLREEAHQVAVLDALAAWLEQEPPRVEARLLEEEQLARLITLLPAGAAASAGGGADGEALQSLLVSLLRLLQRSPRLAVAMAQGGLTPRVVELLKRPTTGGATSALCLLDMLRAMYEPHPRPKEFILKSRVQPVLTALAHGQSAANQVLVRKQAQNLLDAFQANVVL